MQESLVKKKFYKDFSDIEAKYLEDILDKMCGLEIEIPAYIYKRMLERDIIENESPLIIDTDDRILIPGVVEVVKALESGIIYEISTEGLNNTRNPFRMVVAYESGEEVLFLKIKPLKNGFKTKIMDLWKISSRTIPTYPPIKTIDQFDRTWDFVSDMEKFFIHQKELVPL